MNNLKNISVHTRLSNDMRTVFVGLTRGVVKSFSPRFYPGTVNPCCSVLVNRIHKLLPPRQNRFVANTHAVEKKNINIFRPF